MPVYKMTTEDLCKYISNTVFEVKLNNIQSTEGTKTDMLGKTSIVVKNIIMPGIDIKADAFIEANGDIKFVIEIPEYTYKVITKELADQSDYIIGMGNRTDTECVSQRENIVVDIKKTTLSTYDDFVKIKEDIIQNIKEKITQSLNGFINTQGTVFEGITLTIDMKIETTSR